MRILNKLAAASLVAILAAPAALAAPQGPKCVERDALVEQLRQQYHEVPHGIGLANQSTVFELLTAPGGQTWTLLLLTPDGRACMVAAGENWEFVTPKPGRPL